MGERCEFFNAFKVCILAAFEMRISRCVKSAKFAQKILGIFAFQRGQEFYKTPLNFCPNSSFYPLIGDLYHI